MNHISQGAGECWLPPCAPLAGVAARTTLGWLKDIASMHSAIMVQYDDILSSADASGLVSPPRLQAGLASGCAVLHALPPPPSPLPYDTRRP